ncbi:MAG: WD40/YVTN/BNR-like repeat-containing protein [Armatimonadota bacterium]
MVLVATGMGLVGLDDRGTELFRALTDHELSRLYVDPEGRILTIADQRAILCAPATDQADRDGAWERLGSLPEDTQANCLAELGGRLWIGAADARLWVMPAEGGAPRRLRSFDDVETRESWDTPWGGPPDVRSISVIAGDRPAIYADIHVGGIVRSFDLGESWSQAAGSLHRDVHRVNVHRRRPNRVYAATARGCFISEDRGETWSQHLEPFEPRQYQRCVMPDFADPDHFLCAVSLGPHPEGETGCEAMIYRTEDGGASWEAAHQGLPEYFYHNINTHMLSASVQRPGVFAFHDDEEAVYLTEDGARSWRRIAGVDDARAVLAI